MDNNKQSENLKWYILRVTGGQETAVKTAIMALVEEKQWPGRVGQIRFMQREKVQIKQGKKKISTRRYGYMFLELRLFPDGQLVDHIRQIHYVQRFLTDGNGQPVAVLPAEVDAMFRRLDKSNTSQQVRDMAFLPGDQVRIIDGALDGSKGTIREISKDRRKITLDIKIFDGWTKTIVSDTQIEKI